MYTLFNGWTEYWKKQCSLNFEKLGHRPNNITIWNQLEKNVHFHVIFIMITIFFFKH